jgi:hypothetical protein
MTRAVCDGESDMTVPSIVVVDPGKSVPPFGRITPPDGDGFQVIDTEEPPMLTGGRGVGALAAGVTTAGVIVDEPITTTPLFGGTNTGVPLITSVEPGASVVPPGRITTGEDGEDGEEVIVTGCPPTVTTCEGAGFTGAGFAGATAMVVWLPPPPTTMTGDDAPAGTEMVSPPITVADPGRIVVEPPITTPPPLLDGFAWGILGGEGLF